MIEQNLVFDEYGRTCFHTKSKCNSNMRNKNIIAKKKKKSTLIKY